jgi:hypothetical protein
LDNVREADYKNVTENTLLRVVDDYHDALSIMAQYPECFQAYKSHIQRKRFKTHQVGGDPSLSATNQGGILSNALQQ